MAGVRAAPEQVEVSWEELAAIMTNVQRTDTPKLELSGWVPAELSKPWRNANNTVAVQALVLDFDDITVEDWDAVQSTLEGFAWFFASSYRHEPISGKMRYRACIKLDRPVPTADWKRFFVTMSRQLGCEPATAKDLLKCSDPCRFFFGPYCPTDGPEPESGIFEGIPLPVDEVLAEAVEPSKSAEPQELSDSPLTHEEISKVVPTRLRSIENANVRNAWEALTRVLDGEPYAKEGNRDNTLLHMSGCLARAFPLMKPEAIVAPIAKTLDLEFEEGLRPSTAKRDSEVLIAKIYRDQAGLVAAKEEKLVEKMQRVGRTEPYTAQEIATW